MRHLCRASSRRSSRAIGAARNFGDCDRKRVACSYNVSVLNAVVLYVGMQAIEQLQLKSQPLTMSTIAHTAFMDIYQNLAVSLDTEGTC